MNLTTCPQRLWDDHDGLTCTREPGHPGAHVFHAADAADRHDATEPYGSEGP